MFEVAGLVAPIVAIIARLFWHLHSEKSQEEFLAGNKGTENFVLQSNILGMKGVSIDNNRPRTNDELFNE